MKYLTRSISQKQEARKRGSPGGILKGAGLEYNRDRQICRTAGQRTDGGKEVLREARERLRIQNIRQNLLLIVSFFAFLGLNMQRDMQKIIAIPVAMAMIVLFFACVPGVAEKRRKVPAGIRCYAFIAAAGVCVYTQQNFVGRMRNALGSGQAATILTILSVALALLAMVALYTLISLLADHVTGTLKPLFRGLSGAEIAVFALITAALMGYSCYAFIRSSAFWNPGMSYEVIYTSDSPSMIEPNVFLWLYHPENDLRQPLFAVFAAPLTAPAYLLSLPFSGLSPVMTPLLMNLAQIAVLMTANLMLTGMMGLRRTNRICFLLIASAAYPTLLFSVMIEQYIVAYFWLIFAAYSYTEKGKAPVIAVSAAGGTLLTSLACLPLAYSAERDGKGVKAFLTATVRAAAGFIMMFLAFGRLDTLLGFTKKAGILASFAGGGSPCGRINQYLSFVTACFAAPDAAVDTATYGHASWQMTGQNILNTDWAGAVLLLLCAVSLILNRRDKAVRIAGAWSGFSVLLLLAVGWGAPENGMILYTLYFGWAFLVLLFRLAERAAEKTGAGWLTPVVSCTIVALLGWLNYRGISEMLAFAISCYPN